MRVYNYQDDAYKKADLLKTVPGHLPHVIGNYLANKDHVEVTLAYFSTMDLVGPMTRALRTALSSTFALPGEGDLIDRILHMFAISYVVQNPSTFPSTDSAHIMAFALLLLNSDLHNPRQRMKMNEEQFITNVRGVLEQSIISDDALREMFEEIRDHPIVLDQTGDEAMALSAPKLKGSLTRKTNGCMAGWKSFFFVLANSCLYYFSSRNQPDPLRMIQLVEVTASRSGPAEIMIEAKNRQIQWVKFRKGGPVPGHGFVWIKLAAETSAIAEKWFYRIKQSIVMVNFSSMANIELSVEPHRKDISDAADDSAL